ncbi:MAG: hypothetical protein WA624_03565 [Methylocella sp.]
MALITEYGGDFELPPEGRHTACLVRFVDIGLQPNSFGSRSRNADLAFEIEDEMTADGRPVLAFKRLFNLSNRSKNFREVVRALSNMHDISGVNTRDLVGKWCEAVIEHVTKDDGSVFANVECRALKGKPPAHAPVSDLVFFSLHPSEFDEDGLADLPDRQREKVKASETYKTLIDDRKLAAKSKGKRAGDIIDDGLPDFA